MPSLLQSLSDLQDVAPADEEEQQDDSRAHYADVGPSVRRRKANLTEAEGVLGGKYEGREARLRDLDLDGQSGEGSESGSGSEDEEEESELDSDEELESEDEEIHSSAASSSSSSSSRSSPRLQPAKKSVRFDKDTQGASMSVKEANGTSSNGASRTLSSSLSSQAQLTKSLREQAREDAQKGEAIQQQLSFWQRTLENRIKVDKVIGGRGLGRVDPAAYSSLLAASDAQDEHDALTSSLLDHSALLLDTQTKLIGQQDGHDQLYEAIEKVGSKRKRAEGEEDSLAAHSQLLSLTLRFGREVLDPFTAATLNRHSTRNSGQSDNSFSATLKTFEQSLIKQIDAAMAGEGGQRLVERTRKYRGEGRRIGAPSTEGEGEAQNGNADADSSVSADTFDDSDFYASLLRSLIESSSTGGTSLGGQHASNTPLQFHARTNTKIKGIDTRASKGRKLRYEVIEKIANFMPKIANREKWSEEMRGRLIDVLPGGAAGGKRSKGEQQQEGGDEEDEEEEIQQAPLQDLGGLRLFG
ncbi:TRAUB-domain-containing protein [Microstroma glucosiphilum]|uniref:Protein BFR2 n=1 Tax=Pseudomicrostroma glucosiphilum TaxID=1684307 RepID=A0A316UBD0_9BASI|nr:TRAUB-domain-containing protein [Pseudomicrostroma glucosiphilum]PWN20325.1 TRAUB-domain-containing protein [Pseudomicrostroma glucosiphilum]